MTNHTQRKLNSKYLLAEKDRWAHDPYQRYFAVKANEPLPAGWRISLDNKNSRFSHEYIPLATKTASHPKDAVPECTSHFSYTTPNETPHELPSKSPLILCKGTLKCNDTYPTYPSPDDSEIVTELLPKPIHVSSLSHTTTKPDLGEISRSHTKYVGHSEPNLAILNQGKQKSTAKFPRLFTGT
ncbi:hypothetical protein OGAPHI_006277 [Ogataea philodendri]|uniref:Uncharacterized protein n=1 Tax=Ogataea philodendri TaxID=1378263 RepID=A0A9P8NZG4_9ASCO|nr:uncharacterized protein OGAPHI_006277 [Ogataea philodendri]KAH3662096.1 hypothetical protein OGAPHI_006277 [Ogataea philodendri]